MQILAEEELNPVFNNEITFIDSETGENIKMSLTPSLIKEYKNTLKRYNKGLESLVKKYGGKIHLVGKFFSLSTSKIIEKIKCD